MKKNQFFSRAIFFTLGLSIFTACSVSFSNWEYNRATRAEMGEDYSEAIKHYERVLKRDPGSNLALESARKASVLSLYRLADFEKAIDFFRYLVAHSPDSGERRKAQKQIAAVRFEKQTQYRQAILEYNRLLGLKLEPEDLLEIRLRIAKSHYYLSEFFQAESEVNNALKIAEKGSQKFELEHFLASIYFNSKRVEKAIELYRRLLEEYPDLAKKEKVEMSLVVSYEELGKFREAIEKLEAMKTDSDDPEFLDLKIARLKQRIRNLPGSRGLRK